MSVIKMSHRVSFMGDCILSGELIAFLVAVQQEVMLGTWGLSEMTPQFYQEILLPKIMCLTGSGPILMWACVNVGD
jgi:hypothetical protein